MNFQFFKGLDKIIDILISHGADPNIKKNDGETPLHFAAYHSNFENQMKEFIRLSE